MDKAWLVMGYPLCAYVSTRYLGVPRREKVHSKVRYNTLIQLLILPGLGLDAGSRRASSPPSPGLWKRQEAKWFPGGRGGPAPAARRRAAIARAARYSTHRPPPTGSPRP